MSRMPQVKRHLSRSRMVSPKHHQSTTPLQIFPLATCRQSALLSSIPANALLSQASNSYIQPYTRRRIDMDEAVAGTLSNFVARELETEHGNLGLDSGATDLPPLSQFGLALLNSRRSHPAPWLRNHIAGLADRNVALARLRVDIVHENMEVIQEAEALPGGLPHALTVLFDAEIQGILAQSSQIDADLGIKTLAIWAAGADTEQYLLGQLEEVGGVGESACTIERVLHATRGLLMIAKLEARPVLPYSYTFATYVTGGYCSVVDDMRAELGLAKSNEVVDVVEVDEVD